MNSIARKQLCIPLILFMSLIFLLKSSHGYSIFPVKYHLCMMNELTQDPLFLECYSVQRQADSSKNSGGLVIPAHNSYNWSFNAFLVGDVAYYCNADWGTNHSITLFEAFIDRPDFLDGHCGGRHCIWKYADDGIYLYYIPLADFKFMYPW